MIFEWILPFHGGQVILSWELECLVPHRLSRTMHYQRFFFLYHHTDTCLVSSRFIVLSFILGYINHQEFLFVYGIKQGRGIKIHKYTIPQHQLHCKWKYPCMYQSNLFLCPLFCSAAVFFINITVLTTVTFSAESSPSFSSLRNFGYCWTFVLSYEFCCSVTRLCPTL